MDGSWVEAASIDSMQFCIADDALHRMGSGLSVVLDLVPKEGGGGGGMEVESRKLHSSKYRGVVPQPNGRWGAQIYERHLRVWLGTFAAETEAARAYDVAAQRFRGREAATNFGTLAAESDEEAAAELSFLGAHSKAEIVDMLRKHTYLDELEHCKRGGGAATVKRKSPAGGCRQSPSPREMLFEKTVTPSDVGKLNRLVIPKQHAEKHFPGLGRTNGGSGEGVLLHLEDADGKMWRFRYTYWHSSQSYVLTKGWSRFVKEKKLRAGDVVSFWRSAGPENQLYVEWQSGRRAEPPAVRLFGVNISKKQFIQVL